MIKKKSVTSFITACLANINGNQFTLPSREEFELSASEFALFKRLIQSIGGEYVVGQNRYDFDYDPTELMQHLATGKDYQQSTQYFKTPDDVAKKLTDMMSTGRDLRILEPSAGRGSLVKAVLATKGIIDPHIDCCELDRFNRKFLAHLPVNLIGEDFLKLRTAPEEKYDIVIMNPPFNGKEYMLHIEHAWEHLKPGGQLLFVAPTGWMKATQGRSLEFREWVESHATYEVLSDAEFAESGTSIDTVIASMHRPHYDNEYLLPGPERASSTQPEQLELTGSAVA